MSRIVRVGSRDSLLAVKQAEIVINAVKKANPDIGLELVTIKTQGDKILDKSLDKIGGKGLFIKELEQALLASEIDIAVHSYKDMPCEEIKDLPIVALSDREAPFDALVLPIGKDDIDGARPVGSSSLRRSVQLRASIEKVEIAPVRGNVITRLAKLDEGMYSALILAQAGLIRLGLQSRISKVFSPEEMLPSASQGIIAVQGRRDEDFTYLSEFHSIASEYASRAERQFLRTLDGGCGLPVAAYAEVSGREIRLSGMYADGMGPIEKGSMCGTVDEADRLGEKLAISLKDKAVRGW